MAKTTARARRNPTRRTPAKRASARAKGVATVDAYLAAQPAKVRALLRRVRAVIREAVPGGEEVISYQIPAYKTHGLVLLYFAGWREHYSLYPATQRVVRTLQRELAGRAIGKGTIRFALDAPVPAKLIARIAKVREAENAERARARTAAKKKR